MFSFWRQQECKNVLNQSFLIASLDTEKLSNTMHLENHHQYKVNWKGAI